MTRLLHPTFVAAAVLLSAGLGQGCRGRAERLDQRDENHPLMRRAMARKRAQDTDRAIDLFQQALERRPALARAHLELGYLFDQAREDYVRAVYHYERYLEMRPQAQKRDMIEKLARNARLSFAASLPDQPSGAVQQIAELRRENERLRRELAAAQQQIAEIRPENERLRRERAATPQAPQPAASPDQPRGPAAATPGPLPELQPPRPAPPARRADAPAETYTIQSGDNLSRIAAKVYGDAGQWRRIFEANRDVLRSEGSVRPGQVIVIPPAEGTQPHE